MNEYFPEFLNLLFKVMNLSKFVSKHTYINENILIAGDFNMTIGNAYLDNLMRPFDLTTLVTTPALLVT